MLRRENNLETETERSYIGMPHTQPPPGPLSSIIYKNRHSVIFGKFVYDGLVHDLETQKNKYVFVIM